MKYQQHFMPNITKLVKWNLSRPLEQRIGYLDLIRKTELYRCQGNLKGIQAQIHQEITQNTPDPTDQHWALN